MNKRDKFEKLQTLLLDKYIEALEEGEIHFRDLSPIVSFLGQNAVVEKPKKESENEHRNKIEEAKKRREQRESSKQDI